MKANVNWMSEKFNEFNKLYFNGRLKGIKFDLEDTKTYRYGCCHHQLKAGLKGELRRYTRGKQMFYRYFKNFEKHDVFINNSNYQDYLDITIYLNKQDDAPEEVLENTLIHEMIHAYCITQGINCGHTGLFKTYSKEIFEMSDGRYNITTYITSEESKQVENSIRAAKFAKRAAKRAAKAVKTIENGIVLFFEDKAGNITMGLYEKKKLYECFAERKYKKENVFICLDNNILTDAANDGYKILSSDRHYLKSDKINSLFEQMKKNGNYIEK